MEDNYNRLAKVLTSFSTKLKKGEHVLIDVCDAPDDMVIALVRAARKLKAIPHVKLQNAKVNRELYSNGVDEQFATEASWELACMKKMDAYIAIRGSNNIFEFT